MSDAEPLPSATIVPIRDGASGLEVLLLEKAGRARPAPWVFPGGKVEDADRAAPDEPIDSVARRAAVREAEEEAGLVLPTDALRPLSRWITPPLRSRRFDTWFYLAAVEREVAVRVDGGEIGSHRWFAPEEALDHHRRREIVLAPPTFVTVTWLLEHRGAAAALEVLGRAEFLTFQPRICPREDGIACILYPGDAGYEVGDPDRPGPRHRLWATADGYRYERG